MYVHTRTFLCIDSCNALNAFVLFCSFNAQSCWRVQPLGLLVRRPVCLPLQAFSASLLLHLLSREHLCKWFVGLTACTHWNSPPAPCCTSEGLAEAPVCSARSAVFEGHKRVCAALWVCVLVYQWCGASDSTNSEKLKFKRLINVTSLLFTYCCGFFVSMKSRIWWKLLQRPQKNQTEPNSLRPSSWRRSSRSTEQWEFHSTSVSRSCRWECSTCFCPGQSEGQTQTLHTVISISDGFMFACAFNSSAAEYCSFFLV